MKKWIVTLSALLVMTLIGVSLLPLNAQAATVSGKCGDDLTWTFDTGMRVLTISGTGKMWNFDPLEGSQPGWQSYDIYSVVIEEGVTSVGNYAFSQERYIQGTTLPSTVTTLGDYAFNGCNSMYRINLHNNITQMGDGVFIGCDLEQVTIPEKITAIGDNVFSGCSYMKEIIIPKGVTSIGEGAFRYCRALTEVTLPAGLTSLGKEAFSECSGLTSITIPDKITEIPENAFYRCSALETVKLGNKVQSIHGFAFYECTALKTLNVPATLKIIGSEAFYNCINLEGTIYEGCKYLGPADAPYHLLLKAESSDMTTVNIHKDTKVIGSDAFIWGALKTVTIPDGVISINDSAFTGCYELTDVDLPESVEYIGGAFSSCWSLKNIQLPQNLTVISNYMFSGCEALTEITIPEGVTAIGWNAFSNCRSLKHIEIPEGVTTIGDSAFNSCENLTSVTIPDSVVSFGNGVFERCTGLQEATIGNGVKELRGTFDYCWALSKVTLGTQVSYVDKHAFNNCGELQYNVFNGGLYVGSEDNPYLVLVGTEEETPADFVVHPKTRVIAGEAIYGRNEATSVTFGNNIVTVGELAVDSDVQTVYYVGSKEQWNQINIYEENEYLLNAQIVFNAPAIVLPGDFTSDGFINNEDVVYLLWNIMFPEDYPIGINGDITGDGYVNNEDVVYLLWYTMFPEDYPI